MLVRQFASRFVAGLILIASAEAHAQRVSPRDEVLIRQMVENLQRALNRNNPEAWVAEFAPNARFVNRSGEVLQGQKAIQASAVGSFTGFLKGAQSVFRVDRIVPLGADFALVDATHFVRNVRAMPEWASPSGPGAYQTRARYVAQRFDGSDWQVLALQITPIRPQPTARR